MTDGWPRELTGDGGGANTPEPAFRSDLTPRL
jgi:hypothetical protein